MALSVGDLDVDVNQDGVGYGYVRPVWDGHECGGFLFEHETHRVRKFEPHHVWLTDPDVRPS